MLRKPHLENRRKFEAILLVVDARRLNQQPLTKKIIKIADKPYFQALLARARNFSSVT